MGLVAGELAPQVQGLGHRMLVGRHWIAEGKVAEGLEGIIELVKAAVTSGPPAVPLGKGLGPGGRQPEQPVAAVANHVDCEIVASEDVKRRPQPVANGQPLPLQPPRQRRMLRPDAVGNLHQLGIGLQAEHPAAGHERCREFKADEPRRLLGELPIPRQKVAVASCRQTK